MPSDQLWKLGGQYAGDSLDVSSVADEPFTQFREWFAAATAAAVPAVNAMTLATVNDEGRPSARIVLLKEIDNAGFVFFTNYDSQKGKELEDNPAAALVFYWHPLHRQVRIEGDVEKISAKESDAYFDSRPLGSRIGAIISPQSEVIADREWLKARFDAASSELGDIAPSRPRWWGGYRLVPTRVEFWQGQDSRLHDRIRYVREGDDAKSKTWRRERLAP